MDEPTEPLPQVPPQLPKPRKSLYVLITMLALVLIGASLYVYLSNHKTPVALAPVHQDVPVIRADLEGPYNDFYPFESLNTGEAELQFDLYDALVEYHNGTKLTAALATSWENPNQSTWVFHLRHNVKFHTGRTLQSDDVKSSFDAATADDALSQFTSSIKNIDLPDSYTVKITTNSPDPILLNKLSQLPIVDSHDNTKNDPNAGTGPYVVKSGTTPTATSIDMVANDSYWAGRPHVRELILNDKGLDASQITPELISNKADFAGYLPTTAGTSLTSKGFSILSEDDLGVDSLYFNVNDKTSPLSKLAVRQALEYAVDQEAVIKARAATGVPANQVVPPLVPGYNPSLPQITRNLSKAKQLLTTAGYPNGVTLTLSFFSASRDAAVELQKELAEAGITVKLDQFNDIKSIGDKVDSGKAQMWWVNTTTAVFDLSDVVAESYTGINYDSPQVSSLITQASTTFNGAARLTLLEEVSKDIMDDVAAVPIYTPTYQFGYRASLKNVVRDRYDVSAGINWANVYQ